MIITYVLANLFSGRGAYIHFGAIIGTLMAGNVFRVIIPGQKALVAAIERGEAPEAKWAEKAKLHSTHNTYLTLPLLFIMISNHYPMTYAHNLNWVILLVIVAITAVARQYFVLQHKHINKPQLLIGAAIATVILAALIAPKPVAVAEVNESESGALAIRAQQIISERCASCHSANPTDDVFTFAQGGVTLDSAAEMKQWAPRIKARAIDSTDMPFMNKTGMTDEERGVVAAWIASGAPVN